MPDTLDYSQILAKGQSNSLASQADSLNRTQPSSYDLNSVDYDLAQTQYNPKNVLKGQGLKEGEADQVVQGANKRQENEGFWNSIKNGINSTMNTLSKPLDWIDSISPFSSKPVAPQSYLDQAKKDSQLQTSNTPYEDLLNQSTQAYIENKGTDNFFNSQKSIHDFSNGQDYPSKDVQKYLDAPNIMQRMFSQGLDKTGNKLLTLNEDNFLKAATGDPNMKSLLLDGDKSDESNRKMFFTFKDPKSSQYQLGMVSFKDMDEIKKVGGSVISAYGPKPFQQNVWQAFKDRLVGGIAETPKMIADYQKDAVNILGAITPGFNSKKDIVNKYANYFDDLAKIYKTNSSENSETNMFSPESLSGEIGGGFASIGQFAALGGINRAAAIESGLGELLTKELGPNIGRKAFEHVITFGSASILNHSAAYDAAKQAGLDDTNTALYSMTVGALNSAVESEFGTNALFHYLSGGGDKTISRAVINDVTKELDKDLSKVESRAVIDALSKGMPTTYKTVKSSIADFLSKPVVGVSVEEGLKGFGQGLISRASQSLYDQGFGKDKQTGDGRFGTEFFTGDTIKEALKAGFTRAFVSAIADIPRAIRGADSHPSEQGILPHIVDGNTEKVKGVTNKLYDEGFIDEQTKDSYLDRVNKIDEVYNNNKSSFSNLDNYKNKEELKGQALGIVNHIFEFNNNIKDIHSNIADIRGDNGLTDSEKQLRIKSEENKIYDLQTKQEFSKKLLEDYTNNIENPDNIKVKAGEENYINKSDVINNRFNQFNVSKKVDNINERLDSIAAEKEMLSDSVYNTNSKEELTSKDTEDINNARGKIVDLSKQEEYLTKNKEFLSRKLEQLKADHDKITSEEYQKNYKVPEAQAVLTSPDTTNDTNKPQNANKKDDTINRDKISNDNNLSIQDKLESQISELEDHMKDPDINQDTKDQLTQQHGQLTKQLSDLQKSNNNDITQDLGLVHSIDQNLLTIDADQNMSNSAKLHTYKNLLEDINTRVEGNRAKGIKDNTHFDQTITNLHQGIEKYTSLAKDDEVTQGKLDVKTQAELDEKKKLVGSDKFNVFHKDNFFTTVYRLPFMDKSPEFWNTSALQDILKNTNQAKLEKNITISFQPIENLGLEAGKQSSGTSHKQVNMVYPKLNAVVEYMGRKVGLLPESDKLNLFKSDRGNIPINWSALSEADFRKFLSSTADYDLTLQHIFNLQKLEALSEGNRKFTIDELKELGANIQITSTGVVVNNEDRIRLKDLDLAKLPSNGGRPFVYDRSRAISYTEGTEDILGKHGVIDPSTINVSDRYLVLTELPNGKFQWITAQGAKITNEEKTLVFNHLKSIAEQLKNDPTNNSLYVKLKDDLNKMLYITGKPNQDIEIDIRGPKGGAPGRALLVIKENGERTAYGLNKSAKNFDELFSKIDGISDMNFRKNISLNPTEKELSEKLQVNSTQDVLSNFEMKVTFDKDKLDQALTKKSEPKQEEVISPFQNYDATLEPDLDATPASETKQEEQVDNVDKIAQIKAVREDYDKLPDEAQKEILAKIDPVDLLQATEGKALEQARAKRRIDKVINDILANPKYKQDDNNGLVFAVESSRAKQDNLIDIENAKEYINTHLPNFIEVKDVNIINSNIVNNGSTWGAFQNNVIYLSTEAGEGTQYHEAFHAVFRTLLGDNQIKATLNAARNKFGEPTQADIDKLKNSSSAYRFMTQKELRDLALEEHLANDFKQYKLDKINDKANNSVFKRVWDKIIGIYKSFSRKTEELESLYQNIDRGAYKNSSQVTNRFSLREDPAFEIFQTDNNGDKTTTIKEGKNIVYTLAGLLFKASQESKIDDLEAKLDNLIKDKADFNNLDNPFFDQYFKQNNILEGTSRFDRTIENINRLNNIFTIPSNIEKMKKAVLDMYKIFTTEDRVKDEDYEDKVNDIGERWDLDPWSLGGFSSLSTTMREYMAFTLYSSKDIFGRPIETAIDPLVTYKGLTRALAGLNEDAMMQRFKQHSKYNDEAKAFFNKFLNDTGLDSESMDITGTNNPDLLRKFINAFKNENVGWYTVLHDTANSKADVIESNRKSAKNVQVDEWSNRFLGLGGDRLGNKEVKDKFLSALTNIKLEYNKVGKLVDEDTLRESTSNIVKGFKKLGIDVSEGYVYYSLLDRQNELGLDLSKDRRDYHNSYSYNRGLFTNGFEDINEITSQIAKGDNPFVRQMKGEGKSAVETGALSRLERIAETNALFDESVGESTFQNADGKNVYSILKPSYGLTKLRLLKDQAYRKSLFEDKFLSPNGEMLNHLLAHQYSDEIFNQINQSMLDGYRSLTDEGVTFGKFNGEQYLQSELALFLNRKPLRANIASGDKVESRKVGELGFFNINQMEASNTAYLVNLPVDSYYTKEKINSKALDILSNYFKQEAHRILEVKSNFEKEGTQIFKDYNDSKKGRGFKFFEFKGLDIASSLEDKIISEYSTKKEIEKYFKDNKEDINRSIEDKLKQDIAKYTELIKDQDLLETSQKSLGRDITNKNDVIGDQYLNSYINTLGINNLLIEDPAKGIKSTIDWFKRAKGIIGSGNDLGKGTHKVAVTKDPIRYLTKDLERSDSEKDNEVKTGDAQSHVTLDHRIDEVKAWGRYNSDIDRIYTNLTNGKKISFEDYKKLAENGAALNSVKTVTYDGEHYFKLSELILTPNLVGDKDKDGNTIMKTIVNKAGQEVPFPKSPEPGFEYHYNLYKSMIEGGVDQHIYESGSKMATLNPSKFSASGNYDFSKSTMEIDNQFKRLQVETPTGKTKIVDGTQLIQLISSEQKDDMKVDFPYNKDIKTLGDLRTHYRQLLSDNRLEGFKEALSYVIDPTTNKTNISKLTNKFFETVKDSGAGEVMSNFFKPDNFGNRVFNWNLGPIVNKAEQLFLAHFSKGVLSQKVPGLKVSLVSDEGVTKEDGTKLQHMVEDEDGNYYSECMLPAFTKEILDKDPNAIQDVLKMLGTRIPTQDKQSMISLKVVKFLPTEYGSIGIFPHELVYLSGADFDIDSLYIHRPDYYMQEDKLIPYGKYADTPEKKFNEYINYQLSHNSDLVSTFREYLKASNEKDELISKLDTINNDIKQADEDDTELRDSNTIPDLQKTGDTIDEVKKSREEILQMALEDNNLPSTQEEFNQNNPTNIASNNNAMLEAKIKFLTNDYVREGAAKVPATMDSIKDADKLINEELRTLDNYSTSPNTPLERYKANRSNQEGKYGIGPVALMNNLHAFLSIHNVQFKSPLLEIDGKYATGFSGNLTLDGKERKNNELSTLLSAMTDNAKEQLASRLNLTFNPGDSFNTLPVAAYMLSSGYNMEQTMLFINQPAIYNLTKGSGTLTNKIEKELDNRFKPFFDKNSEHSYDDHKYLWLQDQVSGLTTELLKKNISSIKEDNLGEAETANLASQLHIDSEFKNLIKQSRFTQSISSLLSLNKGLESNFIDNKKFDRAVNDTELGHILAWSTKDNYKEAIQDYVNSGIISKQGDKYIKGPNYPELQNKKIPFDPRLAIINDPNTLQNVLLQRKATGEIAKKFFLSQTNFFRDLTNSISNNADSYKYLRSLVMSRAYQKFLQESNPEKFKDLIDKYNQVGGTLKSDPNNIAKQLINLKANDAFGKNPLVRILTVEDNPKSKFVNITFPTRIKTDSDYYVSLVNGYEELFRNKDTKQFAVNLFHYAYFKDGLEFKNNSFINAIGSWMFKDVSNSLDKTNEEMAIKSNNLESLFRSSTDTAKDFIKLYTSDVNTDENSVKKFKVEDFSGVTTRLEKGNYYSIDPFKDTKYDHSIFLDNDKMSQAINESERLGKNIKFISDRFGINDADENVNFKYPINFVSPSGHNIETGESYRKKAYVLEKLTKLEDDGTTREYSLDEVVDKILNGQTDSLSGTKALYKYIEPIGDKLLNSSVQTYDKALSITKDPKITETKTESKEKDLENSEKSSILEDTKKETQLEDNSQETKNDNMYKEQKDLSKFLFGEIGEHDDAIPNDDIENHMNDIDDTDLPIC